MDDLPVQSELLLPTQPVTNHKMTFLRSLEGVISCSSSLREIHSRFYLDCPTLLLCLRFAFQVSLTLMWLVVSCLTMLQERMIRKLTHPNLELSLTLFAQPSYVWLASCSMPIPRELSQLSATVRDSSHRYPSRSKGRKADGLPRSSSPKSLVPTSLVRGIRFPD